MANTMKRDSMDATVPVSLSSKLASTNITTPAPQPPGNTIVTPTLSSLPLSVRKSVFALLLDTELANAGLANVSYTHKLKDNVLHFKASRPPFPVSTALFYVNQEIGREARNNFYERNLFVRLAVYTQDARHAKMMLESSGVLFSAASPEHVSASKDHAMDIGLVEKNSSQQRALVMFPAQYLPRLIHFLQQASQASKSWAPNHAISLKVRNTYGFPIAKLQGDLLELFRLLNNFGRVTVEGEDLVQGYAEGLRESMTKDKFDAAEFLQLLEAMLGQAEEAYANTKFALAAQHARTCTTALTCGFFTRSEILHSQSESSIREIQRLRWRCELVVGKALYELHQPDLSNDWQWWASSSFTGEKKKEIASDLLAAEVAASQALSLATDSPNPADNPWFQTLPVELIPPNKAEWFTDEERGNTYYVCGLVHTALGENLFAAGDLERACGLSPKGQELENAFRTARERINWECRPGAHMQRASILAKGQ